MYSKIEMVNGLVNIQLTLYRHIPSFTSIPTLGTDATLNIAMTSQLLVFVYLEGLWMMKIGWVGE